MSSIIKSAQVVSIATSLIASGGIATLSVFDVPELQSQPASRSLPMTRWLFSRGSHIFPTAAFASSAGFAFLAYAALSPVARAQGVLSGLTSLLKIASNSSRVNLYLAASALTVSIGPFTSLMIPTNFRLIELNEKIGGTRSQKAAAEGQSKQDGASGQAKSADESVNGEGQPSQWTDLSGPQSKTGDDSSDAEDQEVRELLGRFAVLNGVRSLLMAAGGIVGILAAVA